MEDFEEPQDPKDLVDELESIFDSAEETGHESEEAEVFGEIDTEKDDEEEEDEILTGVYDDVDDL